MQIKVNKAHRTQALESKHKNICEFLIDTGFANFALTPIEGPLLYVLGII